MKKFVFYFQFVLLQGVVPIGTKVKLCKNLCLKKRFNQKFKKRNKNRLQADKLYGKKNGSESEGGGQNTIRSREEEIKNKKYKKHSEKRRLRRF